MDNLLLIMNQNGIPFITLRKLSIQAYILLNMKKNKNQVLWVQNNGLFGMTATRVR